MISINVNVTGQKDLEKHINYVKKMISMKSDVKFQKFIQNKCLETVNKITNQRLIGGTTNDEAIQLYKSSNRIKIEKDGFILYNDAVIEAKSKNPEKYPNGKFSVALAFEYGVGITGQGTYTSDEFQPWQYNINNYNFGWKYPLDNGNYSATYGYMGFEIYRYTAIEIKKQLHSWVNEYFDKKEVGV